MLSRKITSLHFYRRVQRAVEKVNATMQVRVTQDDPSSGSPTYTAFQTFANQHQLIRTASTLETPLRTAQPAYNYLETQRFSNAACHSAAIGHLAAVLVPLVLSASGLRERAAPYEETLDIFVHSANAAAARSQVPSPMRSCSRAYRVRRTSRATVCHALTSVLERKGLGSHATSEAPRSARVRLCEGFPVQTHTKSRARARESKKISAILRERLYLTTFSVKCPGRSWVIHGVCNSAERLYLNRKKSADQTLCNFADRPNLTTN
mgnify:CR=1 FL=1